MSFVIVFGVTILLVIIRVVYYINEIKDLPDYRILKVTDLKNVHEPSFRVQYRDGSKYYTMDEFKLKDDAVNYLERIKENKGSRFKHEIIKTF